MQRRKNAAKSAASKEEDLTDDSSGQRNNQSILSANESQFAASNPVFGASAVTVNPQPLLHTPNPHPGRGVYGFALYLFAWIFFVAYLLWALLPHWLFVSLGLTYLPAKYWAIAVPLLLPICVGVYVLTIFAINLIRFHGVFDRINYLQHDFIEPTIVELLSQQHQ